MHHVNQALEEMLIDAWPARRGCNRARPRKSRLREHQVLARLSRQFGVVEEELRLRLRDMRRRAKPAAPPARAKQTDDQSGIEPSIRSLGAGTAGNRAVGAGSRAGRGRSRIRRSELESPTARASFTSAAAS